VCWKRRDWTWELPSSPPFSLLLLACLQVLVGEQAGQAWLQSSRKKLRKASVLRRAWRVPGWRTGRKSDPSLPWEVVGLEGRCWWAWASVRGCWVASGTLQLAFAAPARLPELLARSSFAQFPFLKLFLSPRRLSTQAPCIFAQAPFSLALSPVFLALVFLFLSYPAILFQVFQL